MSGILDPADIWSLLFLVKFWSLPVILIFSNYSCLFLWVLRTSHQSPFYFV